jgi:calcineurin-like phosphoesterase family protein
MAFIYWTADGAGKVGGAPNRLIRWIRSGGSPTLIVNGGDVYNDGKPEEFTRFFDQMDGNVADLCETPGNHDWNLRSTSQTTGEIPAGYEGFWSRFPPPLSQQPIDATRRGGARYEHVKDINGWRLIFLDTGFCKGNPWPMGDADRRVWLRRVLTETPGRAKILFAHHSRLSRGKHGDVTDVEALWRELFDAATGAPLISLTLAGHDHNVSVYGPRPSTNPEHGSVSFSQGIHVIVNGAGGQGHDMGWRGTRPDLFFDEDNFCVTRINLLDASSADVDILSFGPNDPPTVTVPTVVKTISIRL